MSVMVLLLALLHVLTCTNSVKCSWSKFEFKILRSNLQYTDKQIKLNAPAACDIECNTKGNDCAKSLEDFFGSGKVYGTEKKEACDPKSKGFKYKCVKSKQQPSVQIQLAQQQTKTVHVHAKKIANAPKKNNKAPIANVKKNKKLNDAYSKIVPRALNKERHKQFPQPSLNAINGSLGARGLICRENPEQFRKTIKDKALEEGEYFFIVKKKEIMYFSEDKMIQFFQAAGHSSLLTDAEQKDSIEHGTQYVLFAGEFVIDEDKELDHWTNVSGHFKPLRENCAAFAKHWGLTNKPDPEEPDTVVADDAFCESETMVPMVRVPMTGPGVDSNWFVVILFLAAFVIAAISFFAFMCGIFVGFVSKKVYCINISK